MSTKHTIEHGINYHLYLEIFDGHSLHLEIDKAEFEANPRAVDIRIPAELECLFNQALRRQIHKIRKNSLLYGDNMDKFLEELGK